MVFLLEHQEMTLTEQYWTVLLVSLSAALGEKPRALAP